MFAFPVGTILLAGLVPALDNSTIGVINRLPWMRAKHPTLSDQNISFKGATSSKSPCLCAGHIIQS